MHHSTPPRRLTAALYLLSAVVFLSLLALPATAGAGPWQQATPTLSPMPTRRLPFEVRIERSRDWLVVYVAPMTAAGLNLSPLALEFSDGNTTQTYQLSLFPIFQGELAAVNAPVCFVFRRDSTIARKPTLDCLALDDQQVFDVVTTPFWYDDNVAAIRPMRVLDGTTELGRCSNAPQCEVSADLFGLTPTPWLADDTGAPLVITPAPTPTVRYANGYRLRLFYNESSFYVLNPGAQNLEIAAIRFEAVDDRGDPLLPGLDGSQWARYYVLLEPHKCTVIELYGGEWLRPDQCFAKNATLNILPDEVGIFWRQAFRVLWRGEEVGRCDTAGDCEVYLPPVP